MDEYTKDKERNIEKLRLSNEEEDQKLALEQKKALARKAKKEYGRDWRKVLGLVKSLKANTETIHDLYGCDLGRLREAGKPPTGRTSRYR